MNIETTPPLPDWLLERALLDEVPEAQRERVARTRATDDFTLRTSGSLVITSARGSVAGFLPRSTIRNSTSRSVKMPTSLLWLEPSSVTMTQPRCSRCMARIASVTVSLYAKITGSRTGSMDP